MDDRNEGRLKSCCFIDTVGRNGVAGGSVVPCMPTSAGYEAGIHKVVQRLTWQIRTESWDNFIVVIVDFLDALVLFTTCMVTRREVIVRANGAIAADGGVELVIKVIEIKDCIIQVYRNVKVSLPEVHKGGSIVKGHTQWKWTERAV